MFLSAIIITSKNTSGYTLNYIKHTQNNTHSIDLYLFLWYHYF